MTVYETTTSAPQKMTWKQATQCFIHNIKLEGDRFHKTAGAFRAGFLTLATRFAPAAAGVTVCDDLLVWAPPLTLAVALDNFVAVPTVLFVIFSGIRISWIRSTTNRKLRKAWLNGE